MALATYSTTFPTGDYATEARVRIQRVENPSFNFQPATHWDGVASIAIGLGYDLLVHSPSEVAAALAAPGVGITLTPWQEFTLQQARDLRATWSTLNRLEKPTPAQMQQMLDLQTNTRGQSNFL